MPSCVFFLVLLKVTQMAYPDYRIKKISYAALTFCTGYNFVWDIHDCVCVKSCVRKVCL
jgi:hypothetical protein